MDRVETRNKDKGEGMGRDANGDEDVEGRKDVWDRVEHRGTGQGGAGRLHGVALTIYSPNLILESLFTA